MFNGCHNHTCCNLCTPIKGNNNCMNKSMSNTKNKSISTSWQKSQQLLNTLHTLPSNNHTNTRLQHRCYNTITLKPLHHHSTLTLPAQALELPHHRHHNFTSTILPPQQCQYHSTHTNTTTSMQPYHYYEWHAMTATPHPIPPNQCYLPEQQNIHKSHSSYDASLL